MEMNYEPDGWLGLIIGAKLFYEFSGKYIYGDKVKELIREVQEALDSSTDVLVEKLNLEVNIYGRRVYFFRFTVGSIELKGFY